MGRSSNYEFFFTCDWYNKKDTFLKLFLIKYKCKNKLNEIGRTSYSFVTNFEYKDALPNYFLAKFNIYVHLDFHFTCKGSKFYDLHMKELAHNRSLGGIAVNNQLDDWMRRL